MTARKQKANSRLKLKLKFQSRSDEKWTAEAWRVRALMYEEAASNRSFPREWRDEYDTLAEQAWVMHDLVRGITPEMRAEISRKEDEKFAARARGEANNRQLAEEEREARLELYSVRKREKKPTKSNANKKTKAPQLEFELA